MTLVASTLDSTAYQPVVVQTKPVVKDSGGGSSTLQPMVGGRRLYLSGGKIKALPPAPQ